MFEICKNINYLSTKREHVKHLMVSFNKPMVAPSSHSAQQTQAYMAALKEGEQFSVYICLYLTVERTTILYKYTDIIKDEEACQAAEEEALQFMEGMGFIIDESNFESLDISDQEKLLASLPLFKPHAKFVAEAAGENPIKEEIFKEEAVAVIEEIEADVEEILGDEEFAANREYISEVSEKVEAIKSEEKPAQAEENILIPIEKKDAAEESEIMEKWGPELFLSKFRMRAAAERMMKK